MATRGQRRISTGTYARHLDHVLLKRTTLIHWLLERHGLPAGLPVLDLHGHLPLGPAGAEHLVVVVGEEEAELLVPLTERQLTYVGLFQSPGCKKQPSVPCARKCDTSSRLGGTLYDSAPSPGTHSMSPTSSCQPWRPDPALEAISDQNPASVEVERVEL